jgi:hypothetical protein
VNQKDPDWFAHHDIYLAGMACVFISTKLNSIHFGSTEKLLLFFYNERPRSCRDNKQEVLAEYKDPKLREGLESELFKTEFEILRSLNFQFTRSEELPLFLLKQFMRQLEDHHKR